MNTGPLARFCLPLAAGLASLCCHLAAQPTTFRLTAAQSSVSDWKEGTRSSLDITSALHVKHTWRGEALALAATLRAALGGTRQHLGEATAPVLLPTDNDIFAEAALSHPLRWKIDPFLSASIRTQITESFRMVGQKRSRTAALWDPVTTLQSAGATWEHRATTGTGTLRAGLALKQVRARHHVTLTDDVRTRGVLERWKTEAGIELVYDASFRLDSLLAWRGRLTTFTAIHKLEESTILIENEFRHHIWTQLGVVLTIRVQYDPARIRAVQFQQTLSIGLVL